MKKNLLLTALAIVFTGLAVVLIAPPLKSQPDTDDPITFRYIQTGEFNNGGYISDGTIFWATNHSSNALVIVLSAIEVKNGTNWVIQSQPTRSLAFQPPSQPYPLPLLKPHSAGYATLQLPRLPSGTVWRMKVSVAEQLTGPEDAVARIKRYPSLLKVRVQSGDTNIPWTPFSPSLSFLGAGAEVVSQEIVEE